jgi:hypothetical protein
MPLWSTGKIIGATVIVVGFLALATSNYFLFSWWQEERDAATTAGEQLAETLRDAEQCTAGVKALQVESAAAAASAASAVAAAQKKAETLQARAQRQLRTPASTPGDDCKSSAQRFDRWLTERAQP